MKRRIRKRINTYLDQLSKRYPKVRFDLLWFAAFCFATAIVIWLFANHQVSRAEKTRGWAEVTGAISFAEYDYYHDHNARRIEKLDIRYTYDVDGTTYHNDRIAYAHVPNKQKYQRIYEEGRPLTVMYDPDNPSDSVLEHGNPMSRTSGLIWASLCCALGLYCVTICRKPKRR